MTRTRARVGTSQGGNDGDLPPPPPSVNEFFHRILQESVSNGISEQWKNQRAKSGASTFKDFLETKPPIFKETEEPL